MDISKIHINPNNPRIIKDGKFEKLCRSIQEFPKMLELRPIIVDSDGMILGGNMRFKALQYLKMDIKPEWVKEGVLSDEEKRRFVVEDNVGFGEWNWDELANEYDKEELEDWGLDVEKWAEDEIVEDEPPTVEDVAVSVAGEVYQLGNHRLMCGDATKIEDVERLMNGQKADLCYTDPPYGVSYEKKTREIANQRKDILPVKNDELGKDALKEIVFPAFQNIAAVLKEGGCYYISSPQGGELGLMMMMMMNAGIKAKHMIVWAKDAPVFSMGRLDYDYQHEPILYGWRGSHQHYGNGRYKSSLWNIPRPKDSKSHPTMKPIELIVNVVNNSSKQDDIVLDLFGGSGSTLIACEQTNRTCYMMELDPLYCDVIRKRYAKFIGKEEQWQTITPKIQ